MIRSTLGMKMVHSIHSMVGYDKILQEPGSCLLLCVYIDIRNTISHLTWQSLLLACQPTTTHTQFTLYTQTSTVRGFLMPTFVLHWLPEFCPYKPMLMLTHSRSV